MMNYKKHLNRGNQVRLFFVLTLFLACCTDKEEKQDYLARVNDSYLTRNELSALADTSALSDEQKSEIIKNWVSLELLYQEAERNGLIENEDFEKKIEYSRKELAGALLLKKHSIIDEKKVGQQELENFYNSNKNDLKLTSTSFYLNIASFEDRGTAVSFRSELINSDWDKALLNIQYDSSTTRIRKRVLLTGHEIYPKNLARISKELLPLEISIVISDDAGYYSVVQVLNKYEKGTTPPFEVIMEKVKQLYIENQAKHKIEDYIEELYNTNDIEIVNR